MNIINLHFHPDLTRSLNQEINHLFQTKFVGKHTFPAHNVAVCLWKVQSQDFGDPLGFRQEMSKRLKSSYEDYTTTAATSNPDDALESTEFKLALLASLHPDHGQDVLLEYLLIHEGSVEKASCAIAGTLDAPPAKRKRSAATGYQSSLHTFAARGDGESSLHAFVAKESTSSTPLTKSLTRRGKTLHLYSPKDVEQHTPCSIIHNFLPPDEANALLEELLDEAKTFERSTFQLFERVVQSPHTYRFYVDSMEEVEQQKSEYFYGGTYEANVHRTTPWMRKISSKVRDKVNEEVTRRTRDFQPGGRKLKFQSPNPWQPNASFVNCYNGAKENVGYHADQLTYLGPRAIIGSLSLGVAREFRVRRIVPPSDDSGGTAAGAAQADAQGQIAIHLPHNSLLVMHAEMQEEWKHCVAPAVAIDPHPLAGGKRLNVTYRCYQPYLHPRFTPRCRCGKPAVLRCVQKRQATRGRYMWQCYSHYTPGQKGCSYFVWAEFDEDGRPPWVEGYKGNANGPLMAEGTVADAAAVTEDTVSPEEDG